MTLTIISICLLTAVSYLIIAAIVFIVGTRYNISYLSYNKFKILNGQLIQDREYCFDTYEKAVINSINWISFFILLVSSFLFYNLFNFFDKTEAVYNKLKPQQKGKVYTKEDLNKALDHLSSNPFSSSDNERKSFAFGNMSFDNPNVTKEVVDKAAEELKNGK